MEQEVGAAVGGITGILIALVVGLAIGALAKLLMPGKDPGGFFLTALLGIAGSWIGSFVFGWTGIGASVPGALVGAVLGAMLILFVYRIVAARS